MLISGKCWHSLLRHISVDADANMIMHPLKQLLQRWITKDGKIICMDDAVLSEEERAGDYVMLWRRYRVMSQQLGWSLCLCGLAGSGTTTVMLLNHSGFPLRNVLSLYLYSSSLFHLLTWTQHPPSTVVRVSHWARVQITRFVVQTSLCCSTSFVINSLSNAGLLKAMLHFKRIFWKD